MSIKTWKGVTVSLEQIVWKKTNKILLQGVWFKLQGVSRGEEKMQIVFATNIIIIIIQTQSSYDTFTRNITWVRPTVLFQEHDNIINCQYFDEAFQSNSLFFFYLGRNFVITLIPKVFFFFINLH